MTPTRDRPTRTTTTKRNPTNPPRPRPLRRPSQTHSTRVLFPMWQIDLFAAGAVPFNRFWYLLPLIGIVSLVYSASRYEAPDRIVRRAARLCLQIAGFMAAILVLLAVLSMGL